MFVRMRLERRSSLSARSLEAYHDDFSTSHMHHIKAPVSGYWVGPLLRHRMETTAAMVGGVDIA